MPRTGQDKFASCFSPPSFYKMVKGCNKKVVSILTKIKIKWDDQLFWMWHVNQQMTH